MSGGFNGDPIRWVKAKIMRSREKQNIIYACFAYFGMIGEVVGQIVTHDCPDFTVQGASQPIARMECTVWGNRLTGLAVVNRDLNETIHSKDLCMCSKMVDTGAKVSCDDYKELSHTGMCNHGWLYGVKGTLYEKDITNDVYENTVALAHEMELCKIASKKACEENCKTAEATPAKPSLKNGLTCRVPVAPTMPVIMTTPTEPVAPTKPSMMTSPTSQ